MISVLKNTDNYIYAYIEWLVVDAKGIPQNDGRYVCIMDIWVHPEVRGGKVILALVKLIEEDKLSRNVEFVYWQREKYGGRLTRKSFSVDRFRTRREHVFA